MVSRSQDTDAQRATWEAQYALAQERWEAHKRQVASQAEAEAENTGGGSFESGSTSYSSDEAPRDSGTLASDEALAALREKLTGN